MKFKKHLLALSLALSSAAVIVPCSTISNFSQTTNITSTTNSGELNTRGIKPLAALYTRMKSEVETNGLEANGALADIYVNKISEHEPEVRDFIERNMTNIFDDLPSSPYNLVINQIYPETSQNDIDGTNETYGVCEFSINAYVNGTLTPNVPFTLKITGMNNVSTIVKPSVEKSGINANGDLLNQSPYDVSKTVLIDFLYRNYFDIFDNPVSQNQLEIHKNKFNILSVTPVDASTITISARAPGFILNNSLYAIPFQLTIKGLARIPTKFKISEIAISGDLLNYGANSVEPNLLSEFVFSKKEEFFDILPHDLTKDNIIAQNITPSSDKRSLTATISLNKYIGTDGNVQTNPLLSKTITFTGFLTYNTALISKTQIADGDIALKAPYEITKGDISTYVYLKYTTWFREYITTPISVSNFVVQGEINILNSTAISFDINVPAKVDGTITTKTFNITITGLTNKDTIMKSERYSAKGTNLASINPVVVTDDDIKDFILAKRYDIFSNPAAFSSLTLNLNYGKITDNSISVTILNLPAYVNGKLSTFNFVFEIYDMASSAHIQQTEINIKTIRSNDDNFTKIFSSYSKYYIDWQNKKFNLHNTSLNPSTTLKDYLNRNAAKLFNSLPNSTNPVSNVTYSLSTNNTILFNITHSGYNSQLKPSTLNSTITLSLNSFDNSFLSLLSDNDMSKVVLNTPKESLTPEKAVSQIQDKITNIIKSKGFGINIPNMLYDFDLQVDERYIKIDEATGNVTVEPNAIFIQPKIGSPIINTKTYNIRNISDIQASELNEGNNNTVNIVVLCVIITVPIVIILLVILLIIKKKKGRRRYY